MERPFLAIYDFFAKRRTAFWACFVVAAAFLAFSAFRITLEEDISKIFPDDDRVSKLNYILKNAGLAEKVVVIVSQKDTTSNSDPELLSVFADSVIAAVNSRLGSHLNSPVTKIDDAMLPDIFSSLQDALPVYLEEEDYVRMDSMMREFKMHEALEDTYRQLLSPAGIVSKKLLVKDPLGFSLPVFKRLQRIQYDENFELYENYIVTKDYRNLLFFIQPKYAANETRNNAAFQEGLRGILEQEEQSFDEVSSTFFGGSVVAVGNAKQLQRDTILTVSIMVTLLLVVLLTFFRKKRIPFIILLPVVFGGLFSLGIIGLFKASLSILALAVGAVILGVAVDYSLHFLVHLRSERDLRGVIRHIARPLTIGSMTTVVAFLSLQFTNASVLQDVGLFAGLSLIGASLFSLVFLPHLVRPESIPAVRSKGEGRNYFATLANNKYLAIAILIATPVFLYYADDVKFNSDLNALNFMTAETRAANAKLERINNASLSAVYVVSDKSNLESALRMNERATGSLDSLKQEKSIGKYFSVSTFLVSDSLQRQRIERWNSFWTKERRERIGTLFHAQADQIGFSSVIKSNFDDLISKPYQPVPNDSTNPIRRAFFDDYIIETADRATVISMANADPSQRSHVYAEASKAGVAAFDKTMMTKVFVELVHSDFNYIVTVTSILVFFALLLTYGRIELTLITFVPMAFTWIWILGIMALAGIEFNIVNVMVATFIFGLGDDYSIFTMDALQQEYKTGRTSIGTTQTSIILSAFTTICGLGVLIFAEHPALRSVAAISIVGIVCVFVMAVVLQPFFFRVFVTNRVRAAYAPVTAAGVFRSTLTYSFFVIGSFILTIVGLVLRAIPFAKKKLRYVFHVLLSSFTRTLLFLAYNLRKDYINAGAETFSHPSVIIANHSSFLDILLTTSFHPKLILLTNKWVWNSPVFGGVVRLADYYPVMEGAEDSVTQVESRVEEGYSILVFPEGTRSTDGKLRRFHKGAFYMAEKLKLPITPLLIHGAHEAINKGEIYLNDSFVTAKFLSPIDPDDSSFGTGYSERTKSISRHFRKEFERLRSERETPEFFRYRLMMNYVYKGPVLEWYLRVKLSLEENYKIFHELVPMSGTILDLGCGYGFLPYMLQFLSEGRTITGVDYDEEKIATAQHGYLRGENLQFVCADVTQYELATYDAIIISDVLHYLNPSQQQELLERCFAALNPGGRLIIRDGNKDLQERHKGTWLTEFFSVKLLGFNKATNELNFISGKELTEIAVRHGMDVQVVDQGKFTSNVIFIVTRNVGQS